MTGYRDNSEKIFALCSSVTKLGEELNALLETVKTELEACTPQRFVTSNSEISEDSSDWLTAAYAENFTVQKTRSRRGRSRELGVLSIVIDTGRADFISGEAGRALVTVGYAGTHHEPWQLGDLVWPFEPNPQGHYVLQASNIVEWIDVNDSEVKIKKEPAENRAWFFFLPLHVFVNADAVTNYIVKPVLGLLNGESTLDRLLHPQALRFEIRSGEIALAD